ncbi:alpha/beta-hydrolase [Aureobasidium sp. EXF-12298]|nr:alpha/beta-hydrolase [Aureobasidium sp. EXF-12298]
MRLPVTPFSLCFKPISTRSFFRYTTHIKPTRYQSTMQSHACCTVPPVISKGYDAKGTYTTIDGMKTYTTGPSDAKKAILVIYDIFGFKDQTLQGADILATSDKENQYQVFMPDFFEGKPVDINDYPPDTKEKEERLGKFFQTTGAPPKTVSRIPKVIDEIKSQNKNIASFGIVGFCWGGKIVNLSSQKDTVFKAAAACHPAMVDPNDAAGISIPIAMLPSKDEDKEAVEKWEQGVKTKHLVKWYNDQVHGFMAARADLEDENVKKNYMDAYGVLLNFFHEHM